MAQGIQHKIFNQLAPTPEEGPRCIVRQYVFAGAGSQPDDLTNEISEQQISFVQTIWFSTPVGLLFTLTIDQTEQSIQLPAGSQGYIPILAGQMPQFTLSSSAAGTVTISYINVPMPAIIWQPAGI